MQTCNKEKKNLNTVSYFCNNSAGHDVFCAFLHSKNKNKPLNEEGSSSTDGQTVGSWARYMEKLWVSVCVGVSVRIAVVHTSRHGSVTHTSSPSSSSFAGFLPHLLTDRLFHVTHDHMQGAAPCHPGISSSSDFYLA